MIHKGIESRIEDILLIIRVPQLFFLTRALPQVAGHVTVPTTSPRRTIHTIQELSVLSVHIPGQNCFHSNLEQCSQSLVLTS